MAETSIWGATSRAPAAGTMRLPVDTSSSSSPGYLQVSDVAGPIVYTANGVDDTSALTTLFSTSGSYLLKGAIITGAIALTSKNLTIDFDEGATLSPNAELDILWSFTTCNVIYKRFNVDGLGLCQIASYHNGGTLKFGNVTMTNVGWPVHTATGIVSGFFLTSVSDVNGDYFKATLFNAVGDGLFGNIGAVRGIDLLSCGSYDIKVYEYDATNCDGEQIDMFQVNTGNTGGVIHHFKGRYNGNVRRCGKYQSGFNDVLSTDIQKASDFVAVSGSTNIGAKNLNCIDWAASNSGRLNVVSGYIDASGFSAGFVQTIAGSGVITGGSGLFILGSLLQGIRNNPQTGSPETLNTVGFGTTAGALCPGSGLDGTTIQNFYWPIYTRSDYSFVKNCLFIDPVHLFVLGDAGGVTQTKNIIFDNNTLVTETSGYMNATRFITVENVLNAEIKNNLVIADGNASYASRFADFLVATATGFVYDNTVISGQTEVNVGSATVSLAPVGTATTSTNATFYPLFVSSSTNSNQTANLETGLTYNPSTHALTTTTFVGALTGTASGNLVSGGAAGTPSSITLTNGTGLPLTTGVTGTLGAANGGTGVANNAASTITVSGNFGTTLTVTGATTVTLPTSGTLYGTASGSITSAQLATSLTDETGSGANVFGTAPTITGGAITALTSFGMASGQAGQIPQPPYVSGRFYLGGLPGTGLTAANTTPLVDNTVYAVPCYAAAPIVIKTVSLRTSSTSANVAASIKVAVYAADGTNGTPGTRLATTATGTSVADAATTTDIKITLDSTATVPQGWFYIAVLQTSTTGLRFQEASGATTAGQFNGSTSNSNAFAGIVIYGYTVAQAYASGMPSPFGTAVVNATVGLNPAFVFEIN